VSDIPPGPPPAPAPSRTRRTRRLRATRSRFRLNRRWKKVVAAAAAFFVLCMVGIGALVAYSAATLPDINTIGQRTGTIKILDSHGTLISQVGRIGTNRHDVTIDQISPLIQQATVAAEDRNFYNEGAFNPARVVKALIDDFILRRAAEGASTITQQLAKQAFFGTNADKSPLRKVREALLANQLDSKYTKNQILNLYLNITYYGENAYGVESAALRYFGKHAKDVNLMEASMLAGLPEAPSFNDPYTNPTAAYSRMHYVLGSMVAVGDIKQADADAVDPLVGGGSPSSAQTAQQTQNQQTLQTDLNNGKSITASNPAPHFVQYIQDQLQQIFGQDDPALLSGDLTVTTTLDLNIQALASKAVADGVAKLSSSDANNGALLMIDSHTGNIQAMVGSANFADDSIAGQYNIVTASRRPGSSFKPYVYEEGFKSGAFKPDTILQDTRAESQKLNNVPDFDGQFLGPMTAARALVLSRNVATEQAMQMAGTQSVINFAYGLGICTCTPQADNLSTAIGTSAVRMIDHASAYAAFANGGHKVVARGILKITDGSGNVLRDFTQAPNLGAVMTPAQAWSMTSILRNYAKQWNLKFKYDTAGKSGTTDNFVDAWYMTYSPDWVVATWTGHTSGTDPTEHGMNQVFGTSTGAAIAVPFVNTLPKPNAFTPVSGALSDCASADASFGNASACHSATPTPSPTPSDTPSSTPSNTSTPSASASASPSFTIPPFTPTPSPSPSSSSPPAVTPSAGTGAQSNPSPSPSGAAPTQQPAAAPRRRSG
jgi:penicillin-binding protein 1A